MAGRPKTRARRAAERAGGRGRKRTVAERAAAVALAEQVGAAEAARRLDLNPATVRSWRRRLRDELAAGQIPTPAANGATEQLQEPHERLTKAVKLRERAEKLRGGNVTALEQAERLLDSRQAAEARNAVVVASAFAEQAEKLEAAAARAELAEAEFDRTQGRVIAEILRVMGEVLGLPIHFGGSCTSACDRLFAQVLREADGRIDPPEPLCRAARLEADCVQRERVEAELRPRLTVATPPREREVMVPVTPRVKVLTRSKPEPASGGLPYGGRVRLPSDRWSR